VFVCVTLEEPQYFLSLVSGPEDTGQLLYTPVAFSLSSHSSAAATSPEPVTEAQS